LAHDISGKMVEFLKEVVPGLGRVAIVHNHRNPGAVHQVQGTVTAVRAYGLQPHVLEAGDPLEYERAFERMTAERVSGVVLVADPTLVEHRQKIAELAQRSG